ncbi:MAG: bifunctional metallophosphatase/5'-nucleotidase [Defluviitaleaceae bacterium]|nr:bifunctional metallophosphatase/5'-nucleotidase [Defluviitaleaceae bacterium]MCL2275322.1 bifunctional metallophosphatase/5'-nucleotidase [Defluviitaleaceae bacterium]
MSKTLRIYFTSDVHGYLLPVDYARNGTQVTGLLPCARNFVKDENTIIIDAGDILQGAPFVAYLQRHGKGASLIAQTLNRLGYDYITLGNHDFNYGIPYLKNYLENLDAACLCANVNGDITVASFIVHTLGNGLRVGLTGIVTDHVNVWESTENLIGVTVTDPFPAAKEALAQLKGKTDVTVCIYHGGFEGNTGSTENIGTRLCKELDFDLLLTGHQHNAIEGEMHHGTYIVQPKPNGTHAILITGEKTAEAMQFSSAFVTGDGTCDPAHTAPLTETEEKVQVWLDVPVGRLDKPLRMAGKVEMAMNGTPIADFINQVQLDASGADMACTGLPNIIPGFDTDVTLRSVISNYPFSNELVVLEVTGVVLKQVLERVASYLHISENGKPEVSDAFLIPKEEHYNFDFFSGLTYTADLRKPVGARITEMRHNDRIINPSDTFTLATSNYRASGTGGYEIYRQCPVVKRMAHEIDHLLQEYISTRAQVITQRYPAPTFLF